MSALPLPPNSPEDYHSSIERLILELRFRSQQSIQLARQMEQLIRFEIQHNIPTEQRLAARLTMPPQRIAIISDIHGHYAGLRLVLEDIAAQHCQQTVCLGDLVEGGTENEAVVNALRERGIPCVRGNHDEHNSENLPPQIQQFLHNLPEQLNDGDVLYTHISPAVLKRKISNRIEAWNVFEDSPYRLIFVGHAHAPFIFRERSTTFGEATQLDFAYNQPFQLLAGERYIVVVGSVGYGRDRLGKMRYAIFDQIAQTIEHRTVAGPLLPFDYSLRYGTL